MFFEGYTAQQLIVMLVTLILVIMQELFPGVSILKWIKGKWGLAGNQMRIVVIAFFMVLSAIAMYFTGELSGFELQLKILLEYFGWFYIPANIAFEMLKEKNGT